MIDKMQDQEYTTIQIYRQDLQIVTNICKKDENLRDKLHDIIAAYENK
jgi:hypothetical protein